MKKFILACIVLASTTPYLFAIPTIDGESSIEWDSDHFSVIVAEVKALSIEPDSSWNATLAPLFSIAGKFDPSGHPLLKVRSYGPGGSSVQTVPKVGDTVLTVIIRAHDSPRPWFIALQWMSFMPESSALCVIKDPSDPRVNETLKKIQEARARRQRKEAAERNLPTGPSTEKTKGND